MKQAILSVTIALFMLSAFTVQHHHSAKLSLPVKVSGGIKFSKMSLEKAIKEAAKSGKLIFVDMHTSWCVPCKEMAATTFQSTEVGKVFNEQFINLKIDAEKDTDGPAIARTYGVAAYPTLLFIDGQGKLKRKLVGKQSEEKLLSAIKGL